MGEGEMDEQEALTLLRTSLWLRQKLILENPVSTALSCPRPIFLALHASVLPGPLCACSHPAHLAQHLASPQRENPIEVPASPVPSASNLTPTTVGVDWQEGSNPKSVSFRTLRLARAVVSPAQSQAPFPDALQMQPDYRKHAVCTGSTSASRPLVPLPRSLVSLRW